MSQTPDIGDFLAYLGSFSGPIAKTSRYIVTFNQPTIMQSQMSMTSSQSLSWECMEAELPGRAFATKDIRTYGATRKVPFHGVYNDAAFTFYCTGTNTSGLLNLLNSFVGGSISNAIGGALGTAVGSLATGILDTAEGQFTNGMWERGYFDTWIQSIWDDDYGQVGANIAYPDDYCTLLNVTHFDDLGNPTISYNYNYAFPLLVEKQSLSWADEAVLKLTVVMAYRSWSKTQPGSNGSLIMNPLSNILQGLATQAGGTFAGELVGSVLSTQPGTTTGVLQQGLNSII